MTAWTAGTEVPGAIAPSARCFQVGALDCQGMLLLPAATLQDKGFCLGLLLARFGCPTGNIGVPGCLLLAG